MTLLYTPTAAAAKLVVTLVFTQLCKINSAGEHIYTRGEIKLICRFCAVLREAARLSLAPAAVCRKPADYNARIEHRRGTTAPHPQTSHADPRSPSAESPAHTHTHPKHN